MDRNARIAQVHTAELIYFFFSEYDLFALDVTMKSRKVGLSIFLTGKLRTNFCLHLMNVNKLSKLPIDKLQINVKSAISNKRKYHNINLEDKNYESSRNFIQLTTATENQADLECLFRVCRRRKADLVRKK